MKIGILTQPLHDNYGGLLQAYALKEILQGMGHEVIIINRKFKEISKIWKTASILKSKLIGRKIDPSLLLSDKNKRRISEHNQSFIKNYIPNLSHSITDNRGMIDLNNMGFDAYVVGSDQCWRPMYSPQISNYFLDFAENQKHIKRIAYAASFGVSEWEFSEEDCRVCSKLAKKFDAISVREDSGIELVNKHFGMDVVHLIDPTMLLTREHYVKIINKEKQTENEGLLKAYVLDKTLDKQKLIDIVGKKLGLKQFEVLPKKNIDKDEVEDINDFIYPHPVKWLKGFQDAKFVITDSFHGTIFSILFNIPFIAIGNEERGMARFDSLLKMFGLRDRLITNIDSFVINNLENNQIDWSGINLILEKERDKAMVFFKTNLQ